MLKNEALKELDLTSDRIKLKFFTFLRTREIIYFLYENNCWVSEVTNADYHGESVYITLTRITEEFFKSFQIQVMSSGKFYVALFHYKRNGTYDCEILYDSWLPEDSSIEILKKGISFIGS